MTKTIQHAALFLAATVMAAGALQAAGGSPAAAPTPDPTMTPQERAIESYNAGLQHRDKAWELEKELSETTDGNRREKLQARIDKAYGKAIELFESAVDDRPDFYQAHSSLGYARRKTGDYEGSLAAYAVALDLAPDYTEAIEYQAEAHLGLGRVEEAKAAYLDLFARDREKADMLMTAMKGWAAEQREQAGDAPDAKVTELESWIADREEIAMQTAKLSRLESGKAW